MGFLFKKEFDFDIRLLLVGELEGIFKVLSDPVCNGPYSQVTSQSFSLVYISKYTVRLAMPNCWLYHQDLAQTYQLRVSGDTVFNLFFDFVHVRHDAFSNLALLAYIFRFDTICFHDDQISSSFQLCDK